MGVRKRISDGQWGKLEPHMGGKAGDVGATGRDNRLFMEVVLWIMRTGSPWRDLPTQLGNWHTTDTRFKRWGESGRWQTLLKAVSGQKDLEVLMLESTVVRAHQHASGAQKKRGIRKLAVRAAD